MTAAVRLDPSRISSRRRGRTPAAGALLALACSVAAAATDGRASRFYEDALDRYERRDLPGAIVQLKNALQVDRTLLPVQVLLGKALLGNGEAAAAEVALQHALTLGVSRAEVVVPLAQAYIAQGKQPLLLEQPQFAAGGLPKAVRVQLLLLRSAASSDLGDTRGALKAIDEARAIDPGSAEVWLAEVPIRVRGRQLADATAAVDRALSLAPGSAEALYQRATVLHVGGRLDAALAAYDRALAADPQHREARIARAGVYIDIGRSADAARDVAELRRLAPREPRCAYLEALLADRAGDAAAARSALQRVTALIDPAPPGFVRYRPQWLMLGGLAHVGLDQREKARPYLEGFQRLQPQGAAAKLLAQIDLADGNVPRAIDLLEGYGRTHPGDGQAITLLASALMAQGRHAKATALLQEALRTRGDSPVFRTALGVSLIGGGQAADAVPQLEAVLAKDRSQAPAAAALAAVLLRGGQAPRAAALADGLVRRQPSNAGYHNLLGMARAAAGDAAGARVAFDAALRLDAGLLPVQLNLARLDIATGAHDAAAQRLAALLKADERNADVLYELSVLAAQRGQPAEQQRWLDKANDGEGSRQLRSGLALVDFHLKQASPAAALEAARRLSAKAPDDVAVLLAMGRAQLAAGDAAGARTNLANASRRAELDAPRQVEIATLQLAADAAAGAAYGLDKALSARPDFVPALGLMVDVELRRGDSARAESYARRVVAVSPRSALGYGLLGDVAAARGQPAAATAAYRRAHEAEPSALTLLRLFGQLWPQDGGRASLALADGWLKSHPQDRAVRKALADGHARSGHLAAARGEYERLLAIAPADADALNNLANVLFQMKDPGALAAAERAAAASPASAHAIDTLGWIAFHQGQADRALQLLRDARLRDPDNPEIRFHLASVLAQAGRNAAAREELGAALGSRRAFANLGNAQELLKRLP